MVKKYFQIEGKIESHFDKNLKQIQKAKKNIW